MAPLRSATLLPALGLLSACAAPTEPPPLPPELLVVGTVVEVRFEDGRQYLLDDGRTIEALPPARILFEGGPGQPLVLGRDAAGEFVGVFMAQEGLPADCHLPGLGPAGIERGTYIEIDGILWAKAPGFTSTETPVDGAYAGSTRFCFNVRAEVAYTVP